MTMSNTRCDYIKTTTPDVFPAMADRPSFKKQRGDLTVSYVAPDYDNAVISKLGVAVIRTKFQDTLTDRWMYMMTTLESAGIDVDATPANPHETTIHHTQFLAYFDVAKDEAVKMMLAWAAKKKNPTE